MNKFCLFTFTFLISSTFLLTGCSISAQPKIPEIVQSDKNTPITTPEQKPDKSAVQALNPGDYFPTTAGSSWQYQGMGNEYASFTRKVLFVSGNIVQIREDNGGTVTASVFKITPEAVTRIFFQGEAYDQTNYLNAKPTDNTVILKSPLQVGTKWTEPHGTREIIDLNAAVNTPAGDFTQCLKLRIDDGNSTSFEYYKENVGLVKREFISGDDKISSSLIKHS